MAYAAPRSGESLTKQYESYHKPLTSIQLLLERGHVEIVGHEGTSLKLPLAADQPMRESAQVKIEIPRPPGLLDPAEMELPVIFGDDVLLCLNKPAGMPVQPIGEHQLYNVLSVLHARYRSSDPIRDRVPHLAHRLDKYTSGVLVAVLDSKLKTRISRQFESGDVQKEYVAIAHGVLDPPTGVISVPLLRTRNDFLTRIDPAGKTSVTEYKVLETFGQAFSLVQFRPQTGRTHQIRAHAAHAGHPLLCDHMYGGGVSFSSEQLKKVSFRSIAGGWEKERYRKGIERKREKRKKEKAKERGWGGRWKVNE